jgi:hypothetical protein
MTRTFSCLVIFGDRHSAERPSPHRSGAIGLGRPARKHKSSVSRISDSGRNARLPTRKLRVVPRSREIVVRTSLKSAPGITAGMHQTFSRNGHPSDRFVAIPCRRTRQGVLALRRRTFDVDLRSAGIEPAPERVGSWRGCPATSRDHRWPVSRPPVSARRPTSGRRRAAQAGMKDAPHRRWGASALPEPPNGIEPLTYSLRVNRSAD